MEYEAAIRYLASLTPRQLINLMKWIPRNSDETREHYAVYIARARKALRAPLSY
jgi:hypothetical protein